jgi:hypothetical protein
MDTPKASVKKIALNYGLYLGLASVLLNVIWYVMDMHIDRPWYQGLIGFAVMILILVYGLKAFKKDNGGYMSLGEALKTGLAISLIAGIISVIYTFILVNYLEPDFVQKTLELTEEQMYEQNPNLTTEQAEMALNMTEKFMSPGILSAIGLIASLFFGFIISLIAGLIMKQSRPMN